MRCSPRFLPALVLSVAVALTTASGPTAAAPSLPVAADEPHDQSISGRLLSPAGRPLAHVPVSAVRPDDQLPGTDTVAVGSSDETGRYRIDDLPPGSYRILFAPLDTVPLPPDPPRPTDVAPRYWPDAADEGDGGAVVVRPGQHLDGFDAVLGDWSVLRGVVLDASGRTRSSLTVTAWRYQHVADRYVEVPGSVVTGVAGGYEIDDLPAGTYRLGFSDSTSTTWWPAAATLAEAGDIALGQEQTLVRDGTFLDPASLAGRVTTPSGADSSFEIDLERWVLGAWRPQVSDRRFTGPFLVEGLPPGRYRLRFEGENTEWWGDSPTAAGAAVITLGPAGRRTGVDAVLARSQLVGRVRLLDGSPAVGVVVGVRRTSSSPDVPAEAVTTDETGTYQFSLAAGQYDVVVGHPDRVGAEAPVGVTVPHEAVVRLEATVPPGGTVTGRVVDGEGRPMARVGVRVFRPDGAGGWDGPRGHLVPTTDDDGRYRLSRLAPGPVRIGFDRPDLGEPAEYWDDAPEVEQARTIAITSTSVLTRVDAVIVADAAITGRLTDTAGRPAAGVAVHAAREGGFGRVVGAVSAADGSYAVQGLVPGRYRLRAPAGEFLPTELGEVEVPTATSSVPGPDAVLARGASVSGTVRDAAGDPLADAFVRITQGGPTDPWISNVLTSADGRYSFDRLEAGAYDVWTTADLPSGDHVDRIERIQLRADESIARDVVADPTGTLNGTVRNKRGPTEVTVYGRTAQGWTPVDVVPVGLEESWASRVLPPGEYRVGGSARNRLPGFHPAAPSLTQGRTLTLPEGGSVPGVDLALRGGSLRAALEGPTPLTGVELLALDAETGAVLAEATAEQWDVRPTSARADVVLGPLPSRRVRIQVRDPQGRLPVGYLGPTASLGKLVARPTDADIHVVDDGEDESLPTAWVRPGNVLSGQVVPPDGRPRVDTVLAVRDTPAGPAEVETARGLEGGSFTLNGLPAADLRLVYRFTDADGDQEAGDGGCTPSSAPPIRVSDGAGGRATSTDLGVRRLPARPVPGVGGVAPPTVSGQAVTGRTLVADPGPWNPCFLTLGFQWLVAGLPVPGATGRTYAPPARFAGHPVAVRVTGGYPGLTPTTVTSGPSSPLAPGATEPAPRIVNVQAPRVRGRARVGQVLVASAGRWAPASVQLRYRWFRGPTPIRGAIGRRLPVRAAWRGQRLRVVVTASRTGFRTASARSTLTARVR